MDDIVLGSLELNDIRFPTYLEQHGSDALHTSPSYSAAYVILHTNRPAVDGYGFAFTIGRGNEVVLKCVEALEFLVKGRRLNDIVQDFGKFWHEITNECQLRWLGPQKGVIHMAVSAIINSIWDLWARVENKPLWKLIVDMTPEQIVELIDFTYVEDYLSKEDALEILRKSQSQKLKREKQLLAEGYPCYVTSAGWLGYSDDQIKQNLRVAMEAGFDKFKIKVGQDIERDEARLRLVRQFVGDNCLVMIDANQAWSVTKAIEAVHRLAPLGPYWVEEPTSCDDILGHRDIALSLADQSPPVWIATGEHCHNAVMFKQFLRSGAMEVCQIDSCRLAGPNEVLLVLLMAAHATVPVCPHAGGVGLCELVQHYSYIDFIIVSGTQQDRMLEFADHLHEYFETPVVVTRGKYRVPTAAGSGVKFLTRAIEEYTFPGGSEWQKILQSSR